MRGDPVEKVLGDARLVFDRAPDRATPQRLGRTQPSSISPAEIGPYNCIVVSESFGTRLQRDLAGFDDITVVCRLQGATWRDGPTRQNRALRRPW